MASLADPHVLTSSEIRRVKVAFAVSIDNPAPKPKRKNINTKKIKGKDRYLKTGDGIEAFHSSPIFEPHLLNMIFGFVPHKDKESKPKTGSYYKTTMDRFGNLSTTLHIDYPSLMRNE
jgi:hypothetical protein